MITEARGDNYTGEPMAFLLEDSEITETIAPYYMARIVDVPAFLSKYRFQEAPEKLRLHLRVHDPLAPWNDNTFWCIGKKMKPFARLQKKAHSRI